MYKFNSIKHLFAKIRGLLSIQHILTHHHQFVTPIGCLRGGTIHLICFGRLTACFVCSLQPKCAVQYTWPIISCTLFHYNLTNHSTVSLHVYLIIRPNNCVTHFSSTYYHKHGGSVELNSIQKCTL